MWDDAGDGFTGKVKAHGSDIIEKRDGKQGTNTLISQQDF